MNSNDEMGEIKHTKHRLQRSRFHNEELFQAAKKSKFTMVRIIKYPLITGDVEYLITNIEDFTYGEITELYCMRWGIETAYFSIKQKLQIEKFTSSIPQLIKQDFFSGVLAYNIIQSAKRDAEAGIDQSAYKYEMKANENMTIGFVKNELIHILSEDDASKRMEMYNSMVNKISRYRVPVRGGRRFPVRFKTDNNSSINKLKSF